ncbi:hypothetical protein [Gluconacetobacter diazotrophicus]|nr:hypothetical protein [Gluconacetobacter diazotrophicus]
MENKYIYQLFRRFLFLIFFSCHIQYGKAGEDKSCISAALKLPLLGGRTDAPIIPVKVSGVEAAMYISPDYFDGLYMREGGNFLIRPGSIRGEIIENGFHTFPAESTTIDSLEIGGAKVENPKVFRLPGYVTQSINGRPLVGVVGDSILSHFQVLIDMPHGVFFLLKISDDDFCESIEKKLLGENVNSVPIRGKQKEVPVKIDGVEEWFRINTILSTAVVPSNWHQIPELDPNAVAKGELIVTNYVDGPAGRVPGRKIVIHDIHIGHEDMSGTPVLVQNRLDSGALGTEFFANHIVLIDYDRKTMFFSRSANRIQSVGHDLHFEQNIEGKTAIHE